MIQLTKGGRMPARWFESEIVSVAGMRPRLGAVERVVTGVVLHIRADHSTDPTVVRLVVQTDDGQLVDVDPRHVVTP